MDEVRGGTPLKRLLLIKGIGNGLIALTIVVLVSIIEAPQDGRLFGYGMAALYSFMAYRKFSAFRKCSPDARLEDSPDDLGGGFDG